jgi:hypothetical protein
MEIAMKHDNSVISEEIIDLGPVSVQTKGMMGFISDDMTGQRNPVGSGLSEE